jgi:hypothetical protein
MFVDDQALMFQLLGHSERVAHLWILAVRGVFSLEFSLKKYKFY